MKKRSIYILLAMLFAVAHSYAQNEQRGYVRTLGRPNQPGTPLANVTIRVQGLFNAVMTSEQGEFSISAPGKNDGDALVLQSIRKTGYELKDKSLLGRELVFSSSVPIEIIMVDLKQLAADKQRIEDNAYRVAEDNYQKKLKELETQMKENRVTTEQYRKEIRALQNNYEKYLSLIGDMAERYARTDYDEMDSIDREINFSIESGNLERADSLIHTVFNPETVLERNRAAKEEVRKRIEFAQKVIDKATADKEAIRRDSEYAERVSVLSEKLADEYIAQEDWHKAIESLATALEIKQLLYGDDDERVKSIVSKISELKQKATEQNSQAVEAATENTIP